MSLVIDASIALAWCFRDEASPATDFILDRVKDEGAIVPGLWHIELANILSRAERLGRIEALAVDTFLSRMDGLAIATDSPFAPAHRVAVLKLVRSFGLTAYDATYLELAQRLGASIATMDEELKTAAASCSVTCVP